MLYFILLYNKEAVSYTLYSIYESALRVIAIGAEVVLYKLVFIVFIQLLVLILGFSFRYCWFMGKSNTFIYLKKHPSISLDIKKRVREISLIQHCFIAFCDSVYDWRLRLSFIAGV